jgi:hypothetical protein
MDTLSTGETFDKIKQDKQAKLSTLSESDKTKIAEYFQSIGYENAKINANNKLVYWDENDKKEKTAELDWQAQYASYEATEELSDILQDLPNTMKNVLAKFEKQFGSTASQAIKNTLLAEGGTENTKEEFEKIGELLKDPKTLNDFIANNFTENQLAAFGGKNGLVKILTDNYKAQQTIFNNAQKTFDKVLGKNDSSANVLNKNLKSGAMDGYIEQLTKLDSVMSDDNVKKFNDDIANLVSVMDDGQMNTFMSVLNSMDVRDIAAWENLEDVLLDLGPNLPIA